MGDKRFEVFYKRIRQSGQPQQALRALDDGELVAALAACSRAHDPYLANVIATAAQNRLEERGRLEQQLMESEERYRILAEHASDVVMCTDPEGRLVYVSPAVERILGHAPQALLERPVSDLAHPEDQDAVAAAWAGAHPADAEAREVTFRAVRADGATAWLEVTIRPFDLGTGVALGAVGVAREAAARRAGEKGTAWLAAAVDAARDAVIGLALDGTVTMWNPAAEALYGFHAEEVQGQPMARVVPHHCQGQAEDALRRVAAGERVGPEAAEHRRKCGAPVDVVLTLAPVPDPHTRRVMGATATVRKAPEPAARPRREDPPTA